MARHEFGIMDETPVDGDRYDRYEPEKYALISIDDDVIAPLLTELNFIDFFWHSLKVPGKGLAYCGITLIPPKSMDAMIDIVSGTPELCNLKDLLMKAKAESKFLIHYGL